MTLLFVLLGGLILLLFLQLPHMPRRDMSPFLSFHYAHRGLWNDRMPENSLPAFQHAMDHGYGIELDVQKTKDGTLVVFHDANLDRMCSIQGKLQDKTLKELEPLTLGLSSEPIPTLASVLQLVHGQIPLMIEIKTSREIRKVCAELQRMLASYPGPYMIESFDFRAVTWFRFHAPQVRRGQLSYGLGPGSPYSKNVLNRLLSLMLTNGFSRPDFLSFDLRTANAVPFRVVRHFHPWLVGWTCTSQAQMNASRYDWDLFIFESFLPA